MSRGSVSLASYATAHVISVTALPEDSGYIHGARVAGEAWEYTDGHRIMSIRAADMRVLLTRRDIECILGWKRDSFWPDEERVLRKLRRGLEQHEVPRLSRLQLQIVYGWGEEQVGGHFGGGQVLNPEERAVMEKLRAALED